MKYLFRIKVNLLPIPHTRCKYTLDEMLALLNINNLFTCVCVYMCVCNRSIIPSHMLNNTNLTETTYICKKRAREFVELYD
jgi:hypothetical protein